MKKRSIIGAVSILLIASACSEGQSMEADATGPASSAAPRQSAGTDDADSNGGVRTEYLAIKSLVGEREQAMRDQYDDPDPAPAAASDEPDVAFDCGFTDGIDGTLEGNTPQSLWSLELLETAKLASSLEYIATKYGYPDEAWKPKLRRYENREINHIAKLKHAELGDPALAGQRVADLEANEHRHPDEPELDPSHPYYIVDTDMRTYRATRQPELREIQSIEGCGAGESPVLVRGEPEAQRIRLIPGFFSELCKRTNRSLDGDDCPYWFEATQAQPMDLAGYYRYEARWPDGGKAVGTADVDKLHLDEDKEYTELVIHAPGAN